MNIFKHPYTIRRFQPQVIRHGYATNDYEDGTILADIQTMEFSMKTGADGISEVQRIKVFCDTEIRAEDTALGRKADRVFFQGKWFECKSSRLSENTPLRHWTATFTECLK